MSGTGPRRDRSPPYWPEPRGTRGEGLPPHRASSSAMSSIVGSPPGSMEPRIGRDDVIKGTDDDAIISKLSAVDLGYLDDPFVKYFVKRPSRRPPLINRGSYLRTASLDNLTEQFIKSAAGPPPSPPIEHAFPTSTPSFSGVETVKPTTSLATAPSPSLSPSSLSTSAVASVGPSTFPVNKQIVSFGCGSDTRYFNLK
ncbi:carboxy methyl transferase for protein phosphatase 2A, partial [Lobosporangium transversale]